MIAIDPMPDRCGICPCFHAADPMHCQATDPDPEKRIVAPYRDPRPEWCPLEEQKKPKRESKAMLPCKCDGETIREWVRMMGKQKTARLIPRKADSLGYTNEFTCSGCGMTVCMNWYTKRCDYEYCPFCGRKVEGQGEERADET